MLATYFLGFYELGEKGEKGGRERREGGREGKREGGWGVLVLSFDSKHRHATLKQNLASLSLLPSFPPSLPPSLPHLASNKPVMCWAQEAINVSSLS